MSAGPRLCTVVGGFAAQAVVLQRTLAEVLPAASLTVLCIHPAHERALARLGLDTAGVSALEQRQPELKDVRGLRSEREYCWTLKAPLLLDLIDGAADDELVTYVDADVAFHADPTPAWRELVGKSIGISDHLSAPRFRSRERWAGRFNSGWVCFRRDDAGQDVLRWWRDRLLEWCHDRAEDGLFADQGHLRDWPDRFERVHVFEHPGLNVGPWRGGAGLGERDGRAEIDGRPVLCFHAQSLRLRRPGAGVTDLPGAPGAGYTIDRGYRPTALERRLLWQPYVRRLAEALNELRAVDAQLVESLPRFGAAERVRSVLRRGWMRSRELRRG